MLTIPRINGVVDYKGAQYKLENGFRIHIADYQPSIVNVFLQRVSEGFQLEGHVSDNNAAADIQLYTLPDLADEAYSVQIDGNGIRLYAGCDTGMIWALTTLYQMVAEAHNQRAGQLPGVSFTDGPKYAHRGLLVDVSRHFFDMDQMKRVIEEMSVNKLNVLHWHLTDDQGWRIESKVYPKLIEIGSQGSYYTYEQIREIVQFAAARGVEVIPEIEMPGHATAAIASYPELSCLEESVQVGDKAGVYKVIMCAGKITTYEWIYKLMDEVAELFPSTRIHLGGDEAPKTRWKECPHCKALMDQHNLANYEDLQGVFTGKVADYLKAKGKQVICWNESLKAQNVSKEVTAQYWVEMSQESYVFPHYAQGQPMVFSELFHMYFDYPYCIVPLKKTYEYEPKIMGHTNLKGENIRGIEGAIWTERVPANETLEAMISPRIQALAEAAWTVERNYEDFLVRLKAHTNDLGLVKLGSTPFEQATIHGAEAQAQALGFLRAFAGMLACPDMETGMSQEELMGFATAFIYNVFEASTAQQIAASLGFAQ